MRKKIKLLLIFITIAIALYFALWLKVSSDIADALNQKFAGSPHNITSTHRVQFSHATIGGFPFGFGVKLHDFKEDIDRAVAHHNSPVLLGYNMFMRELYLHYNGESIIDIKPLAEKKSRKSKGEFRHSIHIPLGYNTIRNIILDPKQIGVLTNIQNIAFSIKNASLVDQTDGSIIVKKANAHILLSAKHHRTYNTLDEFLNDIPKDYEVSINIANECTSPLNDAVGFSLIYGLYLPINLNYDLKTNFHTGSKTFYISDILSDFSLYNWKSSTLTEAEDSHSTLALNANVSKTNIKFDVDSITHVKINALYSKKLENVIKLVDSMIPPTLHSVKSALKQLDFTAMNFDTQNDPLSVALKIDVNIDEKLNNVAFEIKDFGIKLRDVSFDIKNVTKGGINGLWTSGGVVLVEQYKTLAKYLTDTYFAIYHLPENNQFNKDFYVMLYSDFIQKIANNTNAPYTATIEYEIQHDMTKSKLGKFTWPETTLIYYATLLKHINKVTSNKEEALTQFKIMVPEYVVNSDYMDKIITQSKE